MALEAAPDSLERRLARWRAAHPVAPSDEAPPPTRPRTAKHGGRALALAEALGGSVVQDEGGAIVRIDRPLIPLPIDRDRLALLPGHPPSRAPLVCLDTETTGLGTATGTVAFLIGLGWWEGERFRQVQLVLPDHADEPAILTALARTIPVDGWLVSYNGRGFDWPLLETRYRMARRSPPPLGGHLDLLPFVRRVFRHRLPDARLRSVEQHVLGVHRIGDVDGWEIPGRYLEMLRGASPMILADVIHHNHLDVRSLAQVLALVAERLADPDGRSLADPGDLAGIARVLRRAGRHEDALACLDEALARAEDPAANVPSRPARPTGMLVRDAAIEPPWWSSGRRADFGGRPRASPALDRVVDPLPWTVARMATERARTLRALARYEEAAAAWSIVAAGRGREAALAWVEIAKLHEHRLRDPRGALDAVGRARTVLERARLIGWPDPRLERALDHRAARLRRRSTPSRPAVGGQPVGRTVSGRPASSGHRRVAGGHHDGGADGPG
jgi:tetratricopeptide (TPR) repeat protein